MKNISFRTDVLPLKDILYRLALRITLNREDAEDIVQETLIKVWDKRDSWSEIESIEAFSLTICRNLALDHQRRMENRHLSLDETPIERPDSRSLSPAEAMISTDRISLVRRLVDSLPEKQRSCMQLRDFEGKSYREIAQVLGITEDQVKVNIFRARQTIKQRFNEAEDYGL
ncbi:MAG: RNA polymerase sigma factor [Prevotella sp.]|nr:RNA polymerase sigma factor [Prevotella sp.]